MFRSVGAALQDILVESLAIPINVRMVKGNLIATADLPEFEEWALDHIAPETPGEEIPSNPHGRQRWFFGPPVDQHKPPAAGQRSGSFCAITVRVM